MTDRREIPDIKFGRLVLRGSSYPCRRASTLPACVDPRLREDSDRSAWVRMRCGTDANSGTTGVGQPGESDRSRAPDRAIPAPGWDEWEAFPRRRCRADQAPDRVVSPPFGVRMRPRTS